QTTKSISIYISFDTKGIVSKKNSELIKKSISSIIKQHFKDVIHLKEIKSIDINSLDALQKSKAIITASIFVIYQDEKFIVKTSFSDNELKYLFPTIQKTCISSDELASTSIELLNNFLGPRAQITKKHSDDTYQVLFDIKNNKLPNQLKPKSGDYFQIFQKQPKTSDNKLLKWTVLELKEPLQSKDNSLQFTCKIHTGINLPDLTGLKAVKIPSLPIDRGFKIILNKTNNEKQMPLDICLENSPDKRSNKEFLFLKTNNDGTFIFPENQAFDFKGVAFVKVIKNNTTLAEFPFFKISNELSIINLNLEPEKPYEKEKYIWLVQLNDQLLFISTLFKELNKPNFKDEELTTRITKIEKYSRYTQEKIDNIKSGLNNLKADWPEIKNDNEIKIGEKKLLTLIGYSSELTKYQEKLNKIESEKNTPKRKALDYKTSEARRLAGEGELARAIEILESIFQDSPELETELKQLQKLWLNKSSKVNDARKFIYESLPNLSLGELISQRSNLISYIDACILENDTAGLLKYQKISRDLYLQLDPEKKSNLKSGPSPEESLELINFLEEQNKRISVFFESISKKP
ncbi:MAG: hypothetical protein ACKO7P_02185, partial [Bacteroidota bacterium]